MNKKRILLVALCVVLVAALAIGGTVAWLTASSDAVTNTFTPGDVTVEIKETVENNIKKSVQIKNTGNVDAYIRVAVVVNCIDADGNVILGTPSTWIAASGWTKLGGYYYYNSVVPAGGTTDNLLAGDGVVLKDSDGNLYSVDILAQGIQAAGGTGNTPAVTEAWGVTNSNGSWSEVEG